MKRSRNQKSEVNDRSISPQVLRALCGGSREAYQEVYTRYQKPLCNFIYALTRSEAVAEDIAQEVFISVWENRRKLEPDQGISRYLFAVAKNLVMRYFRRKKTEGHYHQYSLQQSKVGHGSDEWLFAKEAEALIREAAHKMPRIRGEVFKLHYRDGLTCDLIAQKMEMNKATIANHLSHAKSDIKKTL